MGEGEPKYLNSPETSLFEKGRELYGLVQAREAMRTSSRVLVVEGYMDVVALAQFGVGYAVATLGTATTPTHVGKLLRLADEIVFCFDGDAAGRKAAWRALEVSLALALDHKPLKFLFLPEGEDPDTYVRNHGREAFERLALEAQTLSGFLLGELRAGNDLATPEGRSRFLSAAKPHLQKIAAPGLKLQMVKEVAQFARLSQEEAERLLEIRSASPYARAAPARVQASPPLAPESQLLRSLLTRPNLAAELDLELFDQDSPEGRAIAALAAHCRDGERAASLTEARLIEAFAGGPHAELLERARASLLEIEMSEDVAEQEFRQIQLIRRIERKNRELTTVSGAELARRIQELAELKRQRA
jgi:DNA primase